MYIHNQNKNNYYIIDIETDGLTPTRIWLICIKNWGTGEKWEFRNDNSASIYHTFKEFSDKRPEAIYVGHNLISFDAYWLNSFCNTDIVISRCVDTLVLSYLHDPHYPGGHSLEVYGQRTGLAKVANEDWSQLTPNMIERCWTDVEITQRVYEGLIKRMNQIGYSEMSCEIEHKIREIIDRQQRHGFWFDIDGAKRLLLQLRGKQSDLAQQVHQLFPPELQEVARYPVRRKKDGSYYASFQKHIEEYNKVEIDADGVSYGCYDWVEFNIGSPKQRLERLLELGYEPTAKTKKGNPRIDEDSLLAYAEMSRRPEIMAMADWLVHFGRANMLDTWLANVGSDSRIHGTLFTCGASTRRMIHKFPNTATIPSVDKALYGRECRALWGVEPDKGLVLVGYDIASTETVGLCHYLNNPKATEVLIRPKPDDIHSSNARKLSELLKRNIDREYSSKTGWYAWLMGAYPPTLGRIVHGTKNDGQIVADTFVKAVPGLQRFLKEKKQEWKHNKGRIRTIDGGWVICPKESSVLNYHVQPFGAICTKLTAIILDRKLKEQGIESHKVSDVHDEAEHETKEQNGKRVAELAVASIEEAGEQLNCRAKLSGAAKIGMNWSEVH